MTMKPVLDCFTYSLDYLREQVTGVAAEDLATQPKGLVNHPAWVIGHLTYTCQLLGGAIGLSAWLPDEWGKRFGSGSVPVADSRVYETHDRALDVLSDAAARIMRAVEELDESQLDEPFPDALYREVFPTLRHAVTQVLVGHVAYHIGQVGVWRRAMELPPMRRSYE